MSKLLIHEKILEAVRDLTGGLCVNAGAGSGKTSLLVTRYLEILYQSRSDPGRIVAITFTDKAAAEMKTRIRSAMEVQSRDPGCPPHWTGYRDALSNARISTIHSFCTSLLPQYPVEACIDPDFKVLDAVQADLVLRRNLRGHWVKLVENKNTCVLECMEYFQPADLLEIMEALVLKRAQIAELCDRINRVGRDSLLFALAQAQRAYPQNKDLQKTRWSQADDRSLRCARLLLDLSAEFVRAFQDAKARTNHLDFEDLQILALKLLNIPRIRAKVQQDIDYLLVDEFQDTNELQRKIVYDLNHLNRTFIVGDPKQSIYRFRGSDVSVFRRIQDDMPAHGSVIVLDTNYRSVPGILRFCNDFFAPLMLPSDRSYEIGHQPLKPHRSDRDVGTKASCIWTWGHPDVIEDKHVPVDRLRKREAAYIAGTLRRWKDERPPLEKFRWGDVAILFRSMNKVYLYERELEQHGIPFTTSSSSAFFGQQCVTDLLNALCASLNRTDDLAVLGFLRSPMAGISDEVLYRLRSGPSLWDSLCASDVPELMQARTWLENWHRSSGLVPPGDLTGQIIRDTDFEALLLTQHLGGRKVALIRKVIELARRFEPQDGFTCQDFIHYMKELVLEERREAEGPPLDQADAVSLLTVHKSKGLEFPVVIVADLGHHQNIALPDVLIHEEFGLGIKLRDERNESIHTIQRLLAELEEKRKETAEAKRILYVAATRARDLLIFSGLNPAKRKSNPWNQWILDYLDSPAAGNIHQETIPTALASSRIIAPAPDVMDTAKISPEQWKFAMADIRQTQLGQTRWTVSELEHKRTDLPSEAQAEKRTGRMDAAQIGTLVHQVLARWNLKSANDLPTLINGVLRETYVEQSRISDVRKTIHELTQRFWLSPCCEVIKSAKNVYHEIPFVLPLGDEYVEGIIDCLYQNQDGTWAVLDFKTDAVSNAQVPGRAKEYEIQMKLYGAACLRIHRLTEVRLQLYFLTPEALHEEQFTATQAEEFLTRLRSELKTP